MKIRKYVEALVIAAVLVAAGCGARAKQSEDASKCLQRCNLGAMQCMEALECTDMSGQLIPCEAQCEKDRAECEEHC